MRDGTDIAILTQTMMPATPLLSTHEIVIPISGLAATDRFGQFLARMLPDGAVIALIGTLGAGKTRLVQAVAAASGVEPDVVSSPTFVLLHEYDGNRPIYHVDAYRLGSADDFRRLGPDDYFEGDGLTFVEWADKFPDVLPAERLEIRMDIVDETAREFLVTAYGERFQEFWVALKHNGPTRDTLKPF